MALKARAPDLFRSGEEVADDLVRCGLEADSLEKSRGGRKRVQEERSALEIDGSEKAPANRKLKD